MGEVLRRRYRVLEVYPFLEEKGFIKKLDGLFQKEIEKNKGKYSAVILEQIRKENLEGILDSMEQQNLAKNKTE